MPVLEPISNEETAILYRLITLPKGSLKIATLIITPSQATSNYGEDVTFTIKTDNGDDPQGWVASVRDTDIAKMKNNKVTPDSNGLGSFIARTGIAAGGKSGLTLIDIVAVNSGARGTMQLTVSASGS